MSDSFGGYQSENDGVESSVDTLTEGGYSEEDFDNDFTADSVEEADDLTDDDADDDSDEVGETRKNTAGRAARGAKASAARPKAGAQFGWSDVEAILNFITKYNEGSNKEQAALKAVFGVAPKADALATAQALHGGAAHLAVYKDASAFIDTILKGKFDLAATFGLISDLSKRDDDYVRDFFKTVNAFLSEEVRYRKNAPLPTLLEPLIFSAMKSFSENDRATIKWIDEVLAVWPK